VARARYPVVSLFSGALGLDLGLERAGLTIAVAVECNRFAAETIRKNRPDIPLIEDRIEGVTTEEILETAGLAPGEPFVVTGGPSCQAFSTAGQRGSVGDPRGLMFREFLRVVEEAQPRFFVMENVRGVLSAAVRHRPLNERGPGFPPLEPDEELGSALILMLEELSATGYHTVFDVVNAADYGVPQTRERVLFVGSRDGELVSMPEPTHAKDLGAARDKHDWVSLGVALEGLVDSEPEYADFTPSKKKFIKLVPEGGNWRHLPPKKRAEALGGAHASWGGRGGFMRRLAWDRPAPALTTRPDCKATMMCHPSETRPLSVRECARIQQFPDDWEFAGGLPQKYIQVGNAVPVGLGEAVGRAILNTARKRKRVKEMGVVVCADDDLLERLANRPSTILNPIRMRKVKTPGAAKAWLNGGRQHRSQILDYVSRPDDIEAAVPKVRRRRRGGARR
jgi:DNA (cytosine-5)-methyltransferase 1